MVSTGIDARNGIETTTQRNFLRDLPMAAIRLPVQKNFELHVVQTQESTEA